MTVTYTDQVTTSTGFGCFLKLLLRWRGSIYKIVWADLLLFLGIYYALNISYLYLMGAYSKAHFVKIVTYCAKYGSLIPLSFVLGFYVNIVYTRWWSQYTSIPFPDNLAIIIGASIKGQDDRARIVRRTIVRYVCVTFTMTLTMMSPKVKKRFPTLNHLVDAGLLTKDEKKIMEDLDNEFPSYSKYWLPLAWAANITTRARHEGIIREDLAVKHILDEINIFRSKCGGMLDYDWISVPLVYTQVVTLATYSYFVITVIGNQFIEIEDTVTDTFIFSFPFMPILEFFFYMGWLKVAETLINPFGEDDDDFEVVWMIDRHIQICFLLVDKIHQEHPKLTKDYYWSKTAPDYLPFTVASQNYMQEYPVQSTENMKIKKTDQDLIMPEYYEDEEESLLQADGTESASGEHSLWKVVNGLMVRRRKGLKGVPLRKVSVKKHEEEFGNEINTYDIESANKITIPILNRPNPLENVEEFCHLKEERLQKRKEKLLKYMELLKANKENSEEKKIIDEIVK